MEQVAHTFDLAQLLFGAFMFLVIMLATNMALTHLMKGQAERFVESEIHKDAEEGYRFGVRLSWILGIAALIFLVGTVIVLMK